MDLSVMMASASRRETEPRSAPAVANKVSLVDVGERKNLNRGLKARIRTNRSKKTRTYMIGMCHTVDHRLPCSSDRS